MKQKRILTSMFFMLSSAIAIFAQSGVPTYPDSLKAAESDEVAYAMQITENLCAPKMQGRGYSADGDKLAANYIVDEMKTIGLDPFGKSFLLPFNVSVNTFPGRMTLQLGSNYMSPGVEFLIDPSSPSIAGTFKAIKITRAELRNTMTRMDKIRQAKNQFLIIDNTTTEGETAQQAQVTQELIDQMKSEEKINVKGVIVYNPALNGRPIDNRWSLSTTQAIRPVFNIIKETDLSNVEQVKVAVDAEYKNKYVTNNVVGMIKGEAKPDSFIVIACHYDNLGMMGQAAIYPGANYGTSGVAMMLSLAKHFELIKPKYSIVFIAFSGNELGYAGAKELLVSPPFAINHVKFFMEFDLAGNGSRGIRVVNGQRYSYYINEMQKIAKQYELLPAVTPMKNVEMSDHYTFSDKDFPCIFLYSLGGSTAYHNLDDTLEMLPYTKFREFQNLMIRFIEKIK